MRYLLALGSLFLGESRWKVRELFQSEYDYAEIFLAYKTSCKSKWESFDGIYLSDIESRAFLMPGGT